ncbi:protein NRT1/ PTR FAMILY 5.8 [Dendrobium catenatum]|uniref:Putative peptide/nitrate transporter n=1 Tax=Dendrobium catenatum TaxID=906689 RepID=A0A2I0XGV4_9ASPA|nr:protein NRT1/ PTR FAMILY 5.8 [Dendrobium catenatum]PKU87146.1 putative peptide/nitrate transporter [Dendrobium catenatum]
MEEEKKEAAMASQGLSKPCILVIVVASVERFAYKGVSSNLVTYLTGGNVKMSASAAAKTVSSWNGVTSMLPLISSVLVDAYWDRYSTITSSSLLYIVGLVGLTSWALLDAWMPIYTLFLPLYLISIGQSGYNPSLQAFGADQLELDEDCREEEKANKKSSFFQWWYFGICTGSLLGNSTMSYIQDNFGWGLGFSIPAVAMALSVTFFLCGSRFYVHKQTKVQKKSLDGIIKAAMAYFSKFVSPNISLPSQNDEFVELELQQKSLREDFEDSKTSDAFVLSIDKSPGIAKMILKLLPIWIVLLMFAVIFQQPATFFTNQGMVMKHNIGRSIVIPPAMLQSAITISIVMLMPLYDKLIIPLSRLITRNDKGITVLQRIGIGMLLSIVAMVVAAFVEMKRLEISKREGPFEEPDSMKKQLNIFWLLPQYILLGVSDIFTVVGMQEFFYSQVPKTMRTIGIGLYLSVFGVGSFVSALLISMVEMFTTNSGKDSSWFSNNMREAKLYNYYWLLALLASLSFFMFASVCKYYGDGTSADASNGDTE